MAATAAPALERDLDAIRNLYRANGFRNVEVTFRLLDDYNGAKAHIAIFIDIKEGPSGSFPSSPLRGYRPTPALR